MVILTPIIVRQMNGAQTMTDLPYKPGLQLMVHQICMAEINTGTYVFLSVGIDQTIQFRRSGSETAMIREIHQILKSDTAASIGQRLHDLIVKAMIFRQLLLH